MDAQTELEVIADLSEPKYRKNLEEKVFRAWKFEKALHIERDYRLDLERDLRQLLEGHARAVMYQILRRSDDALATEAVNKVMLHLDDFQGDSLFTTWAHRILMGVMYDQRRFDRRRKEVSLDTPGFDISGTDSPQMSEMLLTISQVLDKEDYAIFEQLLVWGRTQEEAAEELKLTQGTISKNWERIKGKLQHAFAK